MSITQSFGKKNVLKVVKIHNFEQITAVSSRQKPAV